MRWGRRDRAFGESTKIRNNRRPTWSKSWRFTKKVGVARKWGVSKEKQKQCLLAKKEKNRDLAVRKKILRKKVHLYKTLQRERTLTNLPKKHGQKTVRGTLNRSKGASVATRSLGKKKGWAKTGQQNPSDPRNRPDNIDPFSHEMSEDNIPHPGRKTAKMTTWYYAWGKKWYQRILRHSAKSVVDCSQGDSKGITERDSSEGSRPGHPGKYPEENPSKRTIWGLSIGGTRKGWSTKSRSLEMKGAARRKMR